MESGLDEELVVLDVYVVGGGCGLLEFAVAGVALAVVVRVLGKETNPKPPNATSCVQMLGSKVPEEKSYTMMSKFVESQFSSYLPPSTQDNTQTWAHS